MKNKKEAPMKLFYVGKSSTGAIRLQSQLFVGRDAADFILEDGKLKHWSIGDGGLNFHETDIPYVIVYNKQEMSRQEL